MIFNTDLWCEMGRLNRTQANALMRICATLKPQYVLETGFATGRSAASILYGSSGSILKMLSVDIDLDWTGKYGPEMVRTIESHFPSFRFVPGASEKILNEGFFSDEFPKGIDLAFIDGGHEYKTCAFDLLASAAHLTPRGRIVVDDYFSGPPKGVILEGVCLAVDIFLEHNKQFSLERWSESGRAFAILRKSC